MDAKERKALKEAKARAAKAAQEAREKKESKTRGEVGEYGFGINTVMHKFCDAIAQKALTMDEVQKADWNKKGAVFNSRFRKLVKAGIANKTKDGKMFVVGSKADPGKAKATTKAKAKGKKK